MRANIDRKTGEIRLTRVREVVETVENKAQIVRPVARSPSTSTRGRPTMC